MIGVGCDVRSRVQIAHVAGLPKDVAQIELTVRLAELYQLDRLDEPLRTAAASASSASRDGAGAFSVSGGPAEGSDA
jgi:hypothetical protein